MGAHAGGAGRPRASEDEDVPCCAAAAARRSHRRLFPEDGRPWGQMEGALVNCTRLRGVADLRAERRLCTQVTNQPRSGLRELPGTSSWSRCFQGVRAAGVRGRGGQGPRLRCGRAPRRHRLRVRPASCFPGTTPCSRRLTSGTSNLTATLTPPLTGEDTEHRESKELPTGRTAVRGEGESEPAAPPRGRAPPAAPRSHPA